MLNELLFNVGCHFVLEFTAHQNIFIVANTQNDVFLAIDLRRIGIDFEDNF